MATNPAERRSCEGCRWLLRGATQLLCGGPAPFAGKFFNSLNPHEIEPGCWTAPDLKVTGGLPDALLSPLGRRIKEDWTAPERRSCEGCRWLYRPKSPGWRYSVYCDDETVGGPPAVVSAWLSRPTERVPGCWTAP